MKALLIAAAIAGLPDADTSRKPHVRLRLQQPDGIHWASGVWIGNTGGHGLILTVRHAVRPKPPIKITIEDGTKQFQNHRVDVVAVSDREDLALLRVVGGFAAYTADLPPRGYRFQSGHVLSCGGCKGKDPTIWTSQATTQRLSHDNGRTWMSYVVCSRPSCQGRSGGAAYDGSYLVGVTSLSSSVKTYFADVTRSEFVNQVVRPALAGRVAVAARVPVTPFTRERKLRQGTRVEYKPRSVQQWYFSGPAYCAPGGT